MPQAVDVERFVVGSLLVDSAAYATASAILEPADFFDPALSAVYAACGRLAERGEGIDYLTVWAELSRLHGGKPPADPATLISLGTRVGSTANLEYHSRIVAQKAVARAVAAVGSAAQRAAYDERRDALEVLAEAQAGVERIAARFAKSNAPTLDRLLPRALDAARAGGEDADAPRPTPSGLPSLDAVTGGMHPGDLIVLAGRPGSGKSGAAFGIALDAARATGRPVACFTLEMSAVQVVQRLLARSSGVDVSAMRRRTVTEHDYRRLEAAAEQMSGTPLVVDDTPGLKLADIRARVTKLCAGDERPALVAVDYLQLVKGSGDSREQQVAAVSRGLKELARKCEVPVLALAQLSRSAEAAPGQALSAPRLRHLRDSGSIEQDADVVVMIHRPEYYGVNEDARGDSTAGVAELHVVKNRHGELRQVKARFRASTASFEEWDPTVRPETAQDASSESLPF